MSRDTWHLTWKLSPGSFFLPHHLLPVSRWPFSILKKKKETLPVFFLSFFLSLFLFYPTGMSSCSSQHLPSRHRSNLQLLPNRRGCYHCRQPLEKQINFFFSLPLLFPSLEVSRMGSHPLLSHPVTPSPEWCGGLLALMWAVSQYRRWWGNPHAYISADKELYRSLTASPLYIAPENSSSLLAWKSF